MSNYVQHYSFDALHCVCRSKISHKAHSDKTRKYPCDAMLARYLPSSCVYLSVCLSHVGVVLRRLNLGSCKQRHTIAQGL